MQNKYFKFLIIALALAVIVPRVALASWWNPFSWGWLNRIFHFQQTEQKQEQQNPVACTMEAKLCPDGSSVGREGLKCEFKACPEVKAEIPKDPTAGWKTYKSDIYNYEIKYPYGFKVVKNIVGTGVSDVEYATYTDEEFFYSFEIFSRNNDFLMERCLKDLSGNNITKTRDVNGNIFYAFEENKIGTGGRMELTEGAIQNEYHIIHNNNCYYIKYTITPENQISKLLSQTQEKSKILDQIFSTFKFTTPTDQTAEWKTYANEKIGFQISYPKTWKIKEKSNSVLISNPDILPSGILRKSDMSINIFGGGAVPSQYNNDVEKWAESFIKPMAVLYRLEILSKEKSQIDGANSLKILYKPIDQNTADGNRYTAFRGEIYLIKGGKGYVISYEPYDSGLIEIHNQILSTFKFTK